MKAKISMTDPNNAYGLKGFVTFSILNFGIVKECTYDCYVVLEICISRASNLSSGLSVGEMYQLRPNRVMSAYNAVL